MVARRPLPRRLEERSAGRGGCAGSYRHDIRAAAMCALPLAGSVHRIVKCAKTRRPGAADRFVNATVKQDGQCSDAGNFQKTHEAHAWLTAFLPITRAYLQLFPGVSPTAVVD